jgi:purine-binding chemotaxis protein CheW
VTEVSVDNDSFQMGVLVDAVQEVFEMDETEIKPAPNFGARLSTEFLKGMGKRNNSLFLILDIQKVFSVAELAVTKAEVKSSEASISTV